MKVLSAVDPWQGSCSDGEEISFGLAATGEAFEDLASGVVPAQELALCSGEVAGVDLAQERGAEEVANAKVEDNPFAILQQLKK